jgi:LuxR family maltose regulon positive regulatory protein
MPREELPGYLALARLRAAKGDYLGASEVLRRLDMRWPDIQYCTVAFRILYALKAHPEDAETRHTASQWVEHHPPEIGPQIVPPGFGPAWNDEADYAIFCVWTQVQIILGRPAEVFDPIQAMLEVYNRHGLHHRSIELSLMQTQAFYIQGQRERAWQLLSDALTQAERYGYQRLADQGAILIRLMVEAAQTGIARAYIQRNLENLHTGVDAVESKPKLGQRTGYAPGDLVEPLSSREVEILALIAQGLSNPEIAQKLYLSPNTLKAHTQNIFGKLDVHSRVQAIIKAQELKLI